MDDLRSDQQPRIFGRKVSRRGVVAGLALAPLALEVGRATATGEPQSQSADAERIPLASNLAQGPGRIVHNTSPPLEESPLSAVEGLITPIPLHFIRNHAASPQIDVAAWRLVVDGEVDRALELSYEQVRQLPSQSINVLIECAGNGRSRFSPQASGTPWGQGAVSVAEWTGVPLRILMEMAGVRPNTVQVIARGGDSVNVTRGLPTAEAMRPETMLAWAMNGETLPVAHGFPLRLVVPSWIGVANIKWLERLTASAVPLEGQYQTVNYMVYREGEPPFPATLQPVKAVIARPMAGSFFEGGRVVISGFAWSGNGRIAAVDVSADGGQTWMPAQLLEPNSSVHWVRWQLAWQPAAAGNYTLVCKATDETGATQPSSVPWNRLGYGYNALEGVPVSVAGAPDAAPPPAPPPTSPGAPAEAPPGLPLDAAAAQGKEVFAANCASCHGDAGQGARGPTLIGPNTAAHHVSKDELFNYVKETMPAGNEGSLTDAEYRQVVEYLRRANGLP